MSEQPPKTSKKTLKNQELRKMSSSAKDQPSSRKHQRKGQNPVRIPPATGCQDFGCSNSWICKNSACRAVLSIDDTFCKRCSCCICHLFDDNKDPSLWLVCTSESGNKDSCGLSCHIECALQHQKVGVVDLGQLMQLDGSYCCASCGKVSGILGCWKKQLNLAKDARRVDVLCYRIFLSYRLLDGTSKFKELHEIVSDVKAKLETEVGPVNGLSVKMARGIVSRLSIAGEVQRLCTLAIDKADEWLGAVSDTNNYREGSLPAACRFHFEEVTASSVVLVLIELSATSVNDIEGYKLWYCKSRNETHPKEPICVFPRTERKILISNLQPCTEYSFRIISYTEAGDLGHSEAKCFTKSIEIIQKNPSSHAPKSENGGSSEVRVEPNTAAAIECSSSFKVRDLGKILHLVQAQEQGCLEGISGIDIDECCQVNDMIKPLEISKDQLPAVPDLNVASVPDLNEELTPPSSSRDDEDNTLVQDDALSHGTGKNGIARSHGSGDSQNWAHGASAEVLARSLATNEDTHDCNSILTNGSPLCVTEGTGCLDENFEYCVKIIRWLECEGHIKQDFRLKFLTWFSLRATEQERRVVNTFVQTLIDDPSGLAAQLVDSFSDIVSSKRQRNGFCSKLWH
ncbi:VIN3-like protein 1 [Diospyros lotus]|uniref:VIN3-like protein 1 n=1 Tax=Diospyros lotus TaxID=55363 RepID=UPI00225BB44C|nr:VIN3-like protein 1 [Diospyros lotus]XP_052198963.1 VIN3-like protein 1 [Diospyros lotus]XP_052198964.1 VIN3-like protein 1 [Diospyros lotus]XP_052198965.1 VIN3-like protein 1 [Diospyros lotus]XP_052198966.1 VIN3-like protein 1 [Diospyros lotus]XP_052198967.1 VIN3-like protein 1 [Diospyros lotus]XP_052198968.1 VIN3-like protein 1 [Diospyros lotus]XP_052198969.1 VIN3-like protein 1 [Diospyros lotus]XP_052198970.1 VIN3-like protein 1 [Diospyros lotus]XP_052198972.1 VIN3-like protein 1 [Di